jgi:hypothetical protein
LDEKKGKLICPAGKELYVRNRNFQTRDGYKGIAYMAKITDCRVCELRKKCMKKDHTVARQVTVFEKNQKVDDFVKSPWNCLVLSI